MVLLLGSQDLPTRLHSISFRETHETLVYSIPVQSQEDFAARITVPSDDISEILGLFHNILQSLRRRYHKYIDVGGGNFDQFL